MKKCKKKIYSYPRTPDGYEYVDVPNGDKMATTEAIINPPTGYAYSGKSWCTPDGKFRRLYFEPRK